MICIGLYVFADSILNVKWLKVPDFKDEYIGNEGLSVIKEPMPTDGVIAYKIPKLEKSFRTWSHTKITVESGLTFGAWVELYILISLAESVWKSAS